MTALVVLEGLVIALLLILVVGLLRSHAEILRALRQLGVELDGGEGSHADHRPPVPDRLVDSDEGHDIQGVTPTGRTRSMAVVGVDHTTLVAFLSSGCLTCAAFWDSFRAADDLDLPGTDTQLVIVTKGPAEESPSSIQSKAPSHIPTIMSSQAWDAYGVPITPYFVLIDGPSGRIAGEGAAATWHQLESLLSQAAADGGLRRHDGRTGTTEERRRAVEETLAAHGIAPGDPRLYHGVGQADGEP